MEARSRRPFRRPSDKVRLGLPRDELALALDNIFRKLRERPLPSIYRFDQCAERLSMRPPVLVPIYTALHSSRPEKGHLFS
jgi:hypothetical protein